VSDHFVLSLRVTYFPPRGGRAGAVGRCGNASTAARALCAVSEKAQHPAASLEARSGEAWACELGRYRPSCATSMTPLESLE
jgi:hypothetical protein